MKQSIKIFLVILFAVWCASAAPALVQQKVITSATGDASGVLTTPTTAGNTVIAIVTIDHSACDAMFVSYGSHQLTEIIQNNPGDGITPCVDIWSANNVPAGQAVLEAYTTTSARISANVSEWSGLQNIAPISSGNVGAVSTTVTTNSIAPATADNLIIAVGGWVADDYSTGPTNSFVRLTRTGGNTAWQEGAYLIQSLATTNSTGWTLTAGIHWATAIATYRAFGPTNAQRSAGFWMIAQTFCGEKLQALCTPKRKVELGSSV